MSRRPLASAWALVFGIFSFAALVAAADAQDTKGKSKDPYGQNPTIHYGIEPDRGQYLPDSSVLARVSDRTIRVGDYISAYFGSLAEYRPRPDSAGRVQFLNTMINKEILADAARSVKWTETFEERAVMREHTNTVLANVLMQRTVLDSVRVEEAEVRKAYEQTGYELHLRAILFGSREVAERVRKELLAKKITWHDAVTRYSRLPVQEKPEGDLGWVKRAKVDPVIAFPLFDLKPGEISPVLLETAGYSIYQALERRDVQRASFQPMRKLITDELRRQQTAVRADRALTPLRKRMGIVSEAANIQWAASKFPQKFTTTSEASGTVFGLDLTVPEFDPADTSRVLARYQGGELTLGRFLSYYLAQSPLTRPSIHTAEALQSQVDIAILQPLLVEVAREQGLERDSMAVAMIERRREEMAVEHLYQDSILSRIRVEPKERRRYYDQHTSDFMTFATARYVTFLTQSKAETDSIESLLKAGGSWEAVVKADSLGGRKKRGYYREVSSEDRGSTNYKLIFEQMRTGEVKVVGPDKIGHYLVFKLLDFDPGRLLSYQEAEVYVDESVRNLAAQKMLDQFLERRRRALKIAAHPELVMRVKLIDPTL